MKWLDVTEADLNDALAAVKYGHDPDAARNLIEYFYERIRSGERHNERVLLEFLDHAFGKIVEDNWSPNHAFGLALKRGQYPRKDTTLRDVMAAAYVILLRRRNLTLQETIGEAVNLLSDDSNKGDKAIESAYAQYKAVLECMPDESLKEMFPPGTKFISRDMNG